MIEANQLPGQEGFRSPFSRRVGFKFCILPVVCMATLAVVWGINYLMIGYPLRSTLDLDPRNKSFSLSGRYAHYVNPRVLVLELTRFEGGAPTDLFRAVFQSAAIMGAKGRSFERVELSRSGDTIFFMKGSDFSEMGLEFTAGQNPVYLVRTLPEKLYNVNGERAFSQWSGGLLGVVGKQMEDAGEFARRWVAAKDKSQRSGPDTIIQ